MERYCVVCALPLRHDVNMSAISRRLFCLSGLLVITGCGRVAPVDQVTDVPLYPHETPELRALIVAAARRNDVPVSLVQRVVIRESTHRPAARNGPYYGQMQILPATARSMAE